MEHAFGQGKGHLGRRAAAIARRMGAELVNYADPGCGCGWSCVAGARGDCKARRRHWFTTRNRGEPFNGNTAREVVNALRQAGEIT